MLYVFMVAGEITLHHACNCNRCNEPTTRTHFVTQRVMLPTNDPDAAAVQAVRQSVGTYGRRLGSFNDHVANDLHDLSVELIDTIAEDVAMLMLPRDVAPTLPFVEYIDGRPLLHEARAQMYQQLQAAV